jgi:pimeloyl-ACP methyl ester carboxylesterase
VPVFFFLGRHDDVIPPEASLVFIEKLRAPFKKVVWFEDSGHMLSIEEPAKFNDAMANLVRPLVVGETSMPRVA